MPLVSYIIPCYNSSTYILQCISSVFEQRGVNLEVIVVDDGSTDQSLALIAAFAESNPNLLIKVCVHPGSCNRGVSASRRLGVLHSNGDYICFLDSDDYLIDLDKTLVQVNAFKDDPSLVLAHTSVQVVGSPEEVKEFGLGAHFSARSSLGSYRLLDLRDALKCNNICTSTTMMRADVIKDLRFDAKQYFQFEDWTLWLLLSRLGAFRFIDIQSVAYRLHLNSATSAVMRSQFAYIYSLIEMKIILLARCGLSGLAVRVLFSLRDDIVCLLQMYCVDGISGNWLPRSSRLVLITILLFLRPLSAPSALLSSFSRNK